MQCNRRERAIPNIVLVALVTSYSTVVVGGLECDSVGKVVTGAVVESIQDVVVVVSRDDVVEIVFGDRLVVSGCIIVVVVSPNGGCRVIYIILQIISKNQWHNII